MSASTAMEIVNDKKRKEEEVKNSVPGKKLKEDLDVEKYTPETSPISPVVVEKRREEEKKRKLKEKTDPWKGILPSTTTTASTSMDPRKVKYSSKGTPTSAAAPPGSNGTPLPPGTEGTTPKEARKPPSQFYTPPSLYQAESPLMVDFISPCEEAAKRIEERKLTILISDETMVDLNPE